MSTESKPFLGRCKHKDCDYAIFATEDVLGSATALNEVLPGGAYRMPRGILARCPQNHKVFPLRRVEGTYSEDFKCDSRCMNAKGHTCRCSCGGMNHGRGYAVELQPLVAHARIVAQDPAAFGGRDVDEEDMAAERRLIEAQAADVRYPKQHLGEVDGKVYFEAKLDRKREVNNSVLFVFLTEVRTPITGELLGEAKIEWWMPSYLDDPGFTVGEVYKLKAKVKRHDNDPRWGKTTVVTYLEEV